jgi:phosphoserine phosphatase
VNCPIYDSNEYKMIVFDMDSNLIDAETIDEFARAAGIIGKVEEITKREICENLDFEQTLAEWVRIIRELSLETIPYAVHKIHTIQVAVKYIPHFKSRGYKDAMISGRFEISAMEACKALKNNFVVTNELLVEDGWLKGKYVGSVTQSNPKGAFEELTLFSRVRPERGVVAGEGANDAHIFERAVFAIAFNLKYIIREYVAVVIIEKISKPLSLFLNLFLILIL